MLMSDKATKAVDASRATPGKTRTYVANVTRDTCGERRINDVGRRTNVVTWSPSDSFVSESDQTYTHECVRMHIRQHASSRICTSIHALTHAKTRARTYTHHTHTPFKHTHAHTHAHARMRTHHGHKHTHTHTHMHARIHAQA